MTGKQKRNNAINLLLLAGTVFFLVYAFKSGEWDIGQVIISVLALIFVVWVTLREWPKAEEKGSDSNNKTDDLRKKWKDEL